MELKAFVTQTIADIVGGVKEAQEACEETGAVVNPQKVSNTRREPIPVSEIRFRVGLSESDASGTQGGIGVFLTAVSVGMRDEAKSVAESVTSIEFTVPVILPYKVKQC